MDKDNVKAKDLADPTYLNGQFLIAMPSMKDPRFARSVILLCAHSKEGAMGIIVNQPTGEICFADLLEQLETVDGEGIVPLDDELAVKPVHVGGPVESSRGFVLHSSDYNASDATLPIQPGVCLTATIDILRAIANNEGPEHSFLALGYAGWAPGQLEDELAENGWLNCAIDTDLVFANGLDDKYDQALASLGIDPGFIAAEAGHA